MKLSAWLPHMDLLKKAHAAWGTELPEWHQTFMQRYGPHGTARYLFGDLDELQRKGILVSVIDDYLRTGNRMSFGGLDAFIRQAVKKAPAPPAAVHTPTTDHAELDRRETRLNAQADRRKARDGGSIRLVAEAIGRFPACDCRATGAPRRPIRVKGGTCKLDHAHTDQTYRSLRTEADESRRRP